MQFVDCEYALQPDIPNEKEKDTKARVAVQAKCNNTLVSLAPQFRSGNFTRNLPLLVISS